MFFTREDILKIQTELTKLGVKDSQFEDANTPLNHNDIISIVQGGRNKKIEIRDFLEQLHLLSSDDFLNVTTKFDAHHLTLSEAITIIPAKSRKLGLTITFQNIEGNWEIWQFNSSNIHQFNEISLWIDCKISIDSIAVPDEEDLTISNNGSKSVVKFKDKQYDPGSFSGKGRIYLRKNITRVLDPVTKLSKVVNLLTQKMIGKENTTYIIQYDYDLNGQEVVVPSGCTLQFDGGSISNGLLLLNNTFIQGHSGLYCNVSGGMKNPSIDVGLFGVIGDGITDDTSNIQRAIDYVSSLSGVQYDSQDIKHIDGYQYAPSRVLQLYGRKCLVSNTIVLKNCVSLFCDGGGFIASSTFPNEQFILSTQGARYCGNVHNLVIDGNNFNVKGLELDGIHHSHWDDISVVACRNIGVHYKGGYELIMNNLNIVCANSPVNNSVTGLYVTGGDAQFVGGAIRFYPIGVQCANWGGSNDFVNIHTWGLYSRLKQYICFYLNESSANSFINCTADSPTLQDYSVDNLNYIEGSINGGFGILINHSYDNKFINFRILMNQGALENKGKYFYPIFFTSADSRRNNFLSTTIISSPYWKSSGISGSNMIDATTFNKYNVASEQFKTLLVEDDTHVNTITMNNKQTAHGDNGNQIIFKVGDANVARVYHKQGIGQDTEIGFSIQDKQVNLTKAGDFITQSGGSLGSAKHPWSYNNSQVFRLFGFQANNLPIHYPGDPILLYRSDLKKLVLYNGETWTNVDGTQLS